MDFLHRHQLGDGFFCRSAEKGLGFLCLPQCSEGGRAGTPAVLPVSTRGDLTAEKEP